MKLSLTVPEAADVCGVTQAQIFKWIHAGWLPAKRQSVNKDGDGVGRYLILTADLEECLQNLPAA